MPKKALFVANTFGGLGQAVINDARLFMKNLPEYESKLMTNPSTRDMLREFVSLIESPDNDVVFGVFSHGTQVRDISGDEADGHDECIIMKDGLLIDDNLTALINKYRCCRKLTLFADICHSTVFDHKDFKNKDALTIVTACADNETSKQYASNGCFSLQFWNCCKGGVLNSKELRRRLNMTNQTPQIFVNGRVRHEDSISLSF